VCISDDFSQCQGGWLVAMTLMAVELRFGIDSWNLWKLVGGMGDGEAMGRIGNDVEVSGVLLLLFKPTPGTPPPLESLQIFLKLHPTPSPLLHLTPCVIACITACGNSNSIPHSSLQPFADANHIIKRFSFLSFFSLCSPNVQSITLESY
jgi:hypothetical protein